MQTSAALQNWNPAYYATGGVLTNLIDFNGHINHLDLTAGKKITIWNYLGDPDRTDFFRNPTPISPIPIHMENSVQMDASGILQIMFDADHWDSTISFDAGMAVPLAGTLDLEFADGIDVNAQIGRTFDLFDWTGVTPTGVFTVDTPYQWDLSQLYTTGDVTLLAVPEPNSLGLFLIAAMTISLIIRCDRELPASGTQGPHRRPCSPAGLSPFQIN